MELFRLLGTIIINNTEANKAINDTATQAEDAQNDVADSFSKIGGAFGKVATGIGVAGTAIGGAFIATIESTREYRKEMGLLESAFLTAGHSSEDAKRTYSELNAVMGDSGAAVEASQHLAKIADNEKDLSTWTDIATGVYSEFGAAIPIESLAEASLETQRSGQLTGGLVDALVWAGHSEEEFQKQLDKCTTEQERQDLIMNTLNDTYKEASDQYKETNKDVLDAEKANEKLADAFAEIGKVGEPILTAIKNKIAELMEQAVPKIQDFIDKIKDATKWVKDNEQTIHTWIGIILGATVAIGTFLLILNWGAIMGAAANAIKVVRTAILAMNAAMLANPIGIIVALIVGLVATFIYLWNNVDGFKKFWINAWDNIQKTAVKVKDAVVKAWNSIGKWFTEKFDQVQKSGKDAMDKVKKWFSDTYNSVTKTFSSIPSWFSSKFKSAWNNIKSAFSSWGSFFSGLWTKIKSKFSSIGTTLGTSMGNAVKSGMNRVISSIESTINKGIGLINSAIKLANKLPGINVGTVGKLKLPRLATGGVLKQGQVGILEGSGAEAVVPLEKNTMWINKVADLFRNELSTDYSQTELIDKMNIIIRLLNQLLTKDIYLDTGVLVGELATDIDIKLGKRYKNIKRGNTR